MPIFTTAQSFLQKSQSDFCHSGEGRNRVNKIDARSATFILNSIRGSLIFPLHSDWFQFIMPIESKGIWVRVVTKPITSGAKAPIPTYGRVSAGHKTTSTRASATGESRGVNCLLWLCKMPDRQYFWRSFFNLELRIRCMPECHVYICETIFILNSWFL